MGNSIITFLLPQVADLEDEISDLKAQLTSAQEQKYEACRGLEAEWEEKEAGLLARAEGAEERLREAVEEADRGMGVGWTQPIISCTTRATLMATPLVAISDGGQNLGRSRLL